MKKIFKIGLLLSTVSVLALFGFLQRAGATGVPEPLASTTTAAAPTSTTAPTTTTTTGMPSGGCVRFESADLFVGSSKTVAGVTVTIESVETGSDGDVIGGTFSTSGGAWGYIGTFYTDGLSVMEFADFGASVPLTGLGAFGSGEQGGGLRDQAIAYVDICVAAATETPLPTPPAPVQAAQPATAITQTAPFTG